MSEASSSKNGLSAEELQWKATNTPVDEHTAYALSIAVEDGEITEEEAAEALEFYSNSTGLDWITSDHYPGDEYYDRADLRFGGLYE